MTCPCNGSDDYKNLGCKLKVVIRNITSVSTTHIITVSKTIMINIESPEKSHLTMIAKETERMHKVLGMNSVPTSLSSPSSSTTTPTTTSTTTPPSSPPQATATLTTTISESKKRKSSAHTYTLRHFIDLVWEIYCDMGLDATGKTGRDKKPILSYIDDGVYEEKRKRFAEIENRTNIVLDNLPHSDRCDIFSYAINKLSSCLELKNSQMMFPREHLKFFLATYEQFIKPSDFSDTGHIIKNERRPKTTVTLGTGAILCEYGKGIETFLANLSRSDASDIDALKFIINKRIVLSPKPYAICGQLSTLASPTYEVDKVYTERDTHHIIAVSNCKQALVLITEKIIMQYDGRQFVVMSQNIERLFVSSILADATLKGGDYMILDVLLSTKVKVIDLIKYRINGKTEAPPNYEDRLALILNAFPKIKVVDFVAPGTINDSSYIQKPKVGFGLAYMYTRSNLTAAAVGMSDRHVLLAFRSSANKFIVKTKAIICSPVGYTLATTPTQSTLAAAVDSIECSDANSDTDDQSTSSSSLPTIKYNNEVYSIEGLTDSYQLFENVISVECRDNNKLSSLSTRQVSHISEYKPMAANKDVSIVDTIKKTVLPNADLVNEILMMFCQSNSAHLISDEAKRAMRHVTESPIVNFE